MCKEYPFLFDIREDKNKIYERAKRLINTMNRQDIKMCNLVLISSFKWNKMIDVLRTSGCGLILQGVVIVFLQHLALSLVILDSNERGYKTI